MESMTRRTSSPRSRKYSATASATKQARTRSGAGRSEVATITTERRIPSAPRSCSMKFADFAVALADQGDHVDAGGTRSAPSSPAACSCPRRCRRRCRCAGPLPQGSKPSMTRMPVTSFSLMCSRVQRTGRRGMQRHRFECVDARTAIHGLAEAVEHAAEQLRARHRPSLSPPRRDNGVAEAEAVGFLERHGKHAAVAKADHLGANRLAGASADLAEIADGGGGAARFHQQADQFHHFARHADGIHAGQRGRENG